MNVGIIGSGTMGSGIAQVAATSGCTVKLYDTNQNALLKEDLAYLSGVMKDNVEEFGVDSALITNDEYILFALQHLSTTENLEVVKRGEPTALAERFGIGINLSYKQLTTQEKT